MRALGFNQTKQEIEDIMYMKDQDHSGKIEFEEFVSLMQDKMVGSYSNSRSLTAIWRRRCSTSISTIMSVKTSTIPTM